MEWLRFKIMINKGKCPWCRKLVFTEKYRANTTGDPIYFCSAPCRRYYRKKRNLYDPGGPALPA